MFVYTHITFNLYVYIKNKIKIAVYTYIRTCAA